MPKHRQRHIPLSLHSSGEHPSGGAHAAAHEPARRGLLTSNRRSWLATIVTVGFTLALAAGVGGALLLIFGPEEPREQMPSGPAAETTQTTATTPSPTDTVDEATEEAVDDCREAWQAVQRIHDAARPTMSQWEVHIEAMNRLVAEKISFARANDIWEKTRVGAVRRYERFADVDRRVREDGIPPCPRTVSATCADAVHSATDALDAARTTLATWRRHITDMELLRSGELSPSKAQRLWIETWREGQNELDRYHAAQRDYEEARCPL